MAAFYFLAGTIVLANVMIFFAPAPEGDAAARSHSAKG